MRGKVWFKLNKVFIHNKSCKKEKKKKKKNRPTRNPICIRETHGRGERSLPTPPPPTKNPRYGPDVCYMRDISSGNVNSINVKELDLESNKPASTN